MADEESGQNVLDFAFTGFRIPYCLLVIAAALVLLLPGAGIALPQPPVHAENASRETIEDVLRVMNTERSAHGLRPVSGNERLERAAQWMAEDMARRQTLDHTDSQHHDVVARLEAFGYNLARLMADNIANGQ
jgi:uncharacterized protein YkwD